ncbi:ABC transporter substrate-binding protein [Actinopolymorpha singaporensis]|uniref:Peptide/nickel transport system substrate-binding protein n=1 Tax=Actinopolymorpha singaporensis TaxID=117157 RepID=A0A1H1SII4_9ACTN|nr:ABC transporter substrate-binding protein [Actinopolymorpha singaporensis]SDS47777.1 peptide/nickel transport system substrate-binding protein [Actinopolymorpha singaporensis]
MVYGNGVSRRGFLYGSAVAAGSLMLAACSGNDSTGGNGGSGKKAAGGGAGPGQTPKGSAKKPLAPPKKFSEAPSLSEQVKAGKLPALEKRLPSTPYVIPHHWAEPGNYGGQLQMVIDASNSGAIKEYSYGHSLLRFLNDGLDIGPGLVESWESNADASDWTFHFRKGLKWSDGQPWTTADIMYWWNDMVLNTEHPEVPPDDVRSGRDTVATLTAPDDYTLRMKFDAPAPITPERLAAWVNRGIGPQWMAPKHVLMKYHPTYNKKIKGKDWYVKHDLHLDWQLNPGSPVMTGWYVKSYEEGRSVVLERNPYYWVVDKDGKQLPYIDEVRFNVVKDPQVQKLQMSNGRYDYVHGGHTSLVLGDISGLKQAEKRTGVQVSFWDSGSGTGSICFLNYDYPDDKMREVIRKPEFRQALSHAINRPDARKAIYFDTGEVTTGTLSPKGQMFTINDEAKQKYTQWRDAYVKYDPAKAKSMLDKLGLVDKNGDGKRELPDGSKLQISLDYPADASAEHVQKNNHLKRDWEAVGIKTVINPVPPEAFGDRWGRGELMTTTAWEVGDCSPLIYPGWVIPVETGHWAPLHGQAFTMQTGDPKKLKSQANLSPWKRTPPWMLPEKGDPIDRLWKLYAQARVEPDNMKRIQIMWEIEKIHIDDGPFFFGIVANYPRIVLTRKGLHNVPKKENLALGGWVNPWILPSPAVYDPELYFWDKPEEHKV